MASTYQPLENVWRSRTLAPVTGTCFPSPTRRDVWSRVMKAEIKNILFFCDWRLESTWNFVIKHLWLGNSPAACIFLWFCCYILALYYWDLVVFCFCTLFIQIFDHHSILLQVLEFYYIMKSKYNVNQIEFRYSLLFEDLEKYGFFFLLKLTVAGLLNGSGQLIRIHFGNIRGLTWKFPHQIVCRAVEEMPYSLTDGEQTIPHCLSIN